MNKTTKVSSPVIVGIAASAGGLEAMSKLAHSLPTGQDCVYILAQHMSPKHKSMLVELLSRETRLQVLKIEDEMIPMPDSIYVPPSGVDVIVEDGKIKLIETLGHPATPRPSADRLFKSIAEERGELSAGIVLSGTGSDGSYGIQAIREAGGITIAQTPTSCKYDSMPNSAIETGCVDLILSPEDIGRHINRILADPRDLAEFQIVPQEMGPHADLFQILMSHTGVDFRNYKVNTIHRRIARRMMANDIEDYDAYVDLCRKTPDEVSALYKDFLISVTRFFRDPVSFATLEPLVRKYIEDTKRDKYRVWVVGCATGEEAYSIAVLFYDVLEQLGLAKTTQLQILATDIDDRALSIARTGVYPVSAGQDIPERYLDTYFNTKSNNISIKKNIRRLVTFSRHNIFQDPPFSKIDLACVRNLLIYFNNALQDRVFARIVFSLQTSGLMFLGTSETVNEMHHPFKALSGTQRIYRKLRGSESSGLRQVEKTNYYHMPATSSPDKGDLLKSTKDSWRKYDGLAKVVCPNGFMTNLRREVLWIYGDISLYCEMTQTFRNGLTVNVLKRPLALEAHSLIPLANKSRTRRRGQWHEIPALPDHVCRLTCYPIEAEDETGEDFVLVSIDLQETNKSPALPMLDSESMAYVAHIEAELAQSREALQMTVEELQTSNESLQATNEELQSTNEELQSANEELETTNEELQSTNEELITVNEELLISSDDLESINTELNGILSTLPVPVLTLDKSLMIRNASEKAIDLFRLKQHGTTLGHLSHSSFPSHFPTMLDLCSDVLTTRQTEVRMVRIRETRYRMILTPFHRTGDELYGLTLVLTAVDNPIDEKLIETLQDFGEVGAWHHDFLLDRLFWSRRTYEIHERPIADDHLKMNDWMAYFHAEDKQRVQKALDHAVQEKQSFGFKARLTTHGKKNILAECSGSPVLDEKGNVIGLVGVMHNYSQARCNSLMTQHMIQVQADKGFGFYSYDVENDFTYWSPELFRLLGLKEGEEQTVEAALEKFSEKDRERIAGYLNVCIEQGIPFDYTVDLPAPEGGMRTFRGVGQADLDEQGKTQFVYGSFSLLGSSA